MRASGALQVFCAALALLALLLAALLAGQLAAQLAAPRAPARAARCGGAPARAAPRAPPKNIVVDTLNLAHWLRQRDASTRDASKRDASKRDASKGPLSTAEIAAAVARAAPALRRRFPGEVVFVLKDPDSSLNDGAVRAQYQAAAERARVRIACAERYPPGAEPAGQRKKHGAPAAAHSAAGRDDFYMCLLASQLRCAVATEDRLRDFADFRATVEPFTVISFAHWRALPARDYVRPDARAFAGLRKPRRVGFAELGIE